MTNLELLQSPGRADLHGWNALRATPDFTGPFLFSLLLLPMAAWSQSAGLGAPATPPATGAPARAPLRTPAPAPSPVAPPASRAPLALARAPAPPSAPPASEVGTGGARPGGPLAALYEPIRARNDDAEAADIEMFVGESRVFPTPGVARLAVGNRQMMSAEVLDQKDTILFANAPGTTSLFVWNGDGRYQRIKIHILASDMSRYAREVASFLATIPNARSSVVGDKVIVEGEDLSDADRDKISELAKRYPQIINFTNPVGWEQMVMMDVKVVEFPKSELRELGLKWNPSGGAAIGAIWSPFARGDTDGRTITIGTPGQGQPPISGAPLSSLTLMSAINLGLNAQLNLLEQKGSASILAEPQLSTRSGYKASFLAGGEFPYSSATVNGVTINYKPYGIKLDIEPRVGPNGVIRAVVESEVSAIDASVSSPSGPALTTRRTKTEFNVRQGETIVLAGLIQRSTSADIDKVPLLGDIPVLGALFRSKRFQNRETELVVFVTPSLVDSRSGALAERAGQAERRLGDRMGKAPYLSEPLQPGRDPARPNAAPAAMPVKGNDALAPGDKR